LPDRTIVYYTGNYEHPRLEARVKRTLLRLIGGTPLISVSQKPIEFGKNICVGEVGISSQNAWRQLQIGAQAATTKFVCPAEADFVYPKEFFRFQPEREDTFYCFLPVWILVVVPGRARVFTEKSYGSEGAIIAGRQLLIDRIEVVLSGRGVFGASDVGGARIPDLLNRKAVRKEVVHLSTPIISFKTNLNMHKRAPVRRGTSRRELPGIGTAAAVIKRYMR